MWCVPKTPLLASLAHPSLCLAESFTADHKPLMGEAPEVRGFFLGCGFNSAGKRDLKGSSLGHPNAGIVSRAEPGTHSRAWPPGLSWVLASSPRDDAGRWLREGAGSLDHPRAAGEGHVRLRHQASHPGCPRSPLISFADTPRPWVLLRDGFRGRDGCWRWERVSGQRLCHSLCPSVELKSIMLDGFNEFTRGVYLICLIPLLRKQLPSDTRRLQRWERTG